MERSSLQAATAEVAARDPVLARLVDRVGPLRHRPRDPDGPFGALVRAIVEVAHLLVVFREVGSRVPEVDDVAALLQ